MKQIYEHIREKLNEGADTDEMFPEAVDGLPRGLEKTDIPGFYKVPSTGDFDPRDCSNPRNATSPWCGYNPVSVAPIGLSVQPTFTSCGSFVTVQPTLGFIELPPSYYAYINEECREKYENLPNPNSQGNEPTLPRSGDVDIPPVPFAANEGGLPFSDTCEYVVELMRNSKFQDWDYGSWERQGNITYFEETVPGHPTMRGYHAGKLPIIYGYNSNNVFFNGCVILLSGGETVDDRWFDNESMNIGRTTPEGCQFYSGNPRDFYTGWQRWDFGECEKRTSVLGGINPAWSASQRAVRERPEAKWIEAEYDLQVGYSQCQLTRSTGKQGSWTPFGGGLSPNLIKGTGAAIKRYLANSIFRRGTTGYFIRNWIELNCANSPRLGLPNPQPPTGGDPMGCCDKPGESNKEIIALLKKIDKKLGEPTKKVQVWDEDSRKLGYQKKDVSPADIASFLALLNDRFNHTQEAIGISDLPATMPDTLNVPVPSNEIEKFWNWLTPKKERKIPSLLRYMDWMADCMSAQQGQWQQYVEYEKTVEGKKVKEKVVLPDVATTLRELFKLLTTTVQTQGLDTDILAMCIQNSTNNSVMLTEVVARIRDIQLYLDHNTKETIIEYPSLVTPDAKVSNLKEYLSPSTLKIKVDEWQPGNDRSLQEELDEMKKMLSILLANLGGEVN